MPVRCTYCFQFLLLLVGLAVVMPKCSQAQANGNKGTYNSSGNVAPSSVWIDASAYWTSGSQPDLCTIINGSILNNTYASTYPNGAVIDARGLYRSSGHGAIMCTGTPFDYFNSVSVSPPPTTILLPATGIPITATWVLPNNVKIVGEEQNSVIRAASGFTGSDMIDMGSSAFCSTSAPCSGIAIEHVFIDAQSQSLNGIVNNHAGAASYVNDVTFHSVGCAGLIVGAGATGSEATGSGPYTNINFNSVSGSSCSGGGPNVHYPLCVDLETSTQGVHGITCIGATSTSPDAAIYVNASDNTVEDMHVETFWDGVQVGDTSSTVSNIVVSNVSGGNSTGAMMQNIVHICGANPLSSSGCSSYGTVKDISLLQIAYRPYVATTTSVQDDVTGTSIPAANVTPASMAGMYLLGEPISGVYSLFTTSPTAVNDGATGSFGPPPTWGVGSNSAISGGTCTTPGALYSNTGGGSMTSVFVCKANKKWGPIA